MNAEIIAVGTEMLLGQIANTNGAYLAQQLAGIGSMFIIKRSSGIIPNDWKRC